MVAQTVKNPPAMWEAWIRSLGWEDPLEEGMATHSSVLAWRSPMDRGAWRTAVHGVRVRHSSAQHVTEKAPQPTHYASIHGHPPGQALFLMLEISENIKILVFIVFMYVIESQNMHSSGSILARALCSSPSLEKAPS